MYDTDKKYEKNQSDALPIPFVCGTDYFQVNQCVEDIYKTTSLQPSYQQKLEHPQFNFHRERFLKERWE